MATSRAYLFSVDLEDIRDRVPQGEQYREHVPEMTERYLSFLRTMNSKATFFVVGALARRYPDVIRAIVAEGHEVGCHTDAHIPLTKHTPDSLTRDLTANIEALLQAGASGVSGFRAPCFSLIRSTAWAYRVLRNLGFRYSSSVLPAKNPLFGWPDFSSQVAADAGVIELPITLFQMGPLQLPLAGGVYFRLSPELLLQWAFKRKSRRGSPILGYFHPYDIFPEQERFEIPEVRGPLFSSLMYYGRATALTKLTKLQQSGYIIMRYDEFIAQHNSPGCLP